MKLHFSIIQKAQDLDWQKPNVETKTEKPLEPRQITELTEKIQNLEGQLKTVEEAQFQREEAIRRELKEMSWLFKVLDGQEFDPDSKIEYMTDIQYIGERSRFSRQDILRQNYLRLIALFHPELYAFRDWANFDAAHLISKDGASRGEFVEVKKGNQHPGQVFQIGTGPDQGKQSEAKRGLLDRFRNKQKEAE